MKQLTLRTVLVYPYITLIILLAVAIGSLSYFTGSRAVLAVSEMLLNETVNRISQAIDRHVVGSAATLEAAFPDGMVAPDNIESDFKNIRTRFWIATSLHIDPNNYVYYGNRAGQSIGLYRHSYEVGELRVKFKAHEHRKRFKLEGVNSSPIYQSTEEKLFDPRVRPWYQVGKAEATETWTSVYIDFGTHDLVATRARQVLSSRQEVAGVVATDMPLKALNDFVSNLDISPNGVAFIVELDGNLIASSRSQNVGKDDLGKNIRINASKSSHLLVREVYQQVHNRLSNPTNIIKPFFFYNSEGNEIHVAFNKFSDGVGLEWINVVAMPREDFLSGISKNVYLTLIIAILATIIILALGLSILHWVSKDLKILSKAVNKVGSGNLEESIDIQRRDEIGSLAKSFSAMQRRLQSDHLTGIPNRYAFEQYLNSTIENYNSGKNTNPFAILFIDINNFKLINDSLGHEGGDQALIEFALRLKTHFRKEDFIARYAGDEFVALVKDIKSPEDLQPIKINIEKALSTPLKSFGNKNLNVGGAIGEAHFPEDADNSIDLLRVADTKMYKHKSLLKKIS